LVLFAFATRNLLLCYTELIYMAFTPEQQQQRRQAFIDECHQKAWGAACHADWIGSQLDKLVSDYGKPKAEDEKLGAEIKALEVLAREVRYDPLPRETRMIVIAAWERGGLLPRSAIEQMVPAKSSHALLGTSSASKA
jgi:hypothetical protein